MKTPIALIALALAGCAPMTPEQRAQVGRSFAIASQGLADQQRISAQGYQQMSQNAQNGPFSQYVNRPQPPTAPAYYEVSPNGGVPGSCIVRPSPF